MKQFKDFDIKVKEANFTGEKIRLNQVLNLEITVYGYRVKDSIKKEGTKYLHLALELSGKRHILFTSGVSLIHSIEQVNKEDFPFNTTIVMVNDRCEFS